MKNSTYYQNKILYALSKIDYAKQRMGDKHDKVLSKIYSALLTYGKDAPLKNIVELTGLPKEVVVEKLKELKALGIIEWEGVQLRDEREVSLKKVDFQQWYIDLMRKMKAKDVKNKVPRENYLVLVEKLLNDQTFEDDDDGRAAEFIKLTGTSRATFFLAKKRLEESRNKMADEDEEGEDDWVEIQLEQDLIIKVKKERLKKALL